MKNFMHVLATIMVIFLAACRHDRDCHMRINGNGHFAEKRIDMPYFKKVSFYESCNVHFIVGNTYSVKIIAESNVIDHIEVSNIGGMLRIKPKDGICIQAQDLQVFITAPSIETIEAKGTTTLSGQINADQLSIIVDGTMDMNLAGYARQFSLLTHGTCDFHLYDMEVTTAMIQCDGTARGTIRCAEQLNIEVNGTAFIKYKGTPKISQQVSGSGSVINDN